MDQFHLYNSKLSIRELISRQQKDKEMAALEVDLMGALMFQI